MKGNIKDGVVLTIQSMLECVEIKNGGILVLPKTGCFDKLTIKAVCMFQSKNNLPKTGKVDKKTWQKLSCSYKDRNLQF